ncbi:MAG: methylenetetrahydrofolate reductase [NAD(P)H] [Burkholderiaceae bacterium]|nr:methylenetetrahydrofolate reductase [NAD(P)H] [Burkholderiaceae bacterium]
MTTTVSFEFFPPNTPEGVAKLRATRAALAQCAPEFFSVTYGAGGSTRDKTLATVLEIAAEGQEVAPHISCVGASRGSIAELLESYRASGIRRLVALRGDQPSGMVHHGDFRYASELVEFIRAQTGAWFRIDVAAYPETHPQASSPAHDLQAFVAKVRAGADGAITQYFYNADAFLRFRDDVSAMGVNIPLVPGIMPINNFTQLARFSEACGAEIPRWIRVRLAACGDDREGIRTLGFEVVSQLCRRLVDAGVPSLHFYTLNQATPSRELWSAVAR